MEIKKFILDELKDQYPDKTRKQVYDLVIENAFMKYVPDKTDPHCMWEHEQEITFGYDEEYMEMFPDEKNIHLETKDDLNVLYYIYGKAEYIYFNFNTKEIAVRKEYLPLEFKKPLEEILPGWKYIGAATGEFHATQEIEEQDSSGEKEMQQNVAMQQPGFSESFSKPKKEKKESKGDTIEMASVGLSNEYYAIELWIIDTQGNEYKSLVRVEDTLDKAKCTEVNLYNEYRRSMAEGEFIELNVPKEKPTVFNDDDYSSDTRVIISPNFIGKMETKLFRRFRGK